MAAVAWLLNLAAPLELERPGAWTPSVALRGHLERQIVRAEALLRKGDVLIRPGETLPEQLAGITGRAFCPTPFARKVLALAGAKPEPAPTFQVLRHANHRRLGLQLGAGTKGARFIETNSELAHTLRESTEQGWLFKKPYAFAGRGHRRVRGAPSRDDQNWLERALLQGGLWAEHFVSIELEFALHGYLHPNGQCSLGDVCMQTVDGHGAWVSSRVALPNEVEKLGMSMLVERAEAVAEALRRLGYFGPFGIDGLIWREGSMRHFSLPSEINARYTMGYAVGMQRVACDDTGLPELREAHDSHLCLR